MDGAAPADTEAFEQAVAVVTAANDRNVPLKLLGGQAVRYLCPLYPHRARVDQDMDFASVSQAKRAVMDFLGELGFHGDQRFNTLHGDRQMFFTTPDGKVTVDVVVDRLNMCHVLEFRDRIDRMPHTLDVTDLLLTKLQVVELNRKDVHDMLHLLSAYEVRGGDEAGTIGLARIGKVVGEDWGWWRTVTGNLDKLVQLGSGEHADLVPEARKLDPIDQTKHIREFCDACPKSLKWKLRSKVGDRVQWYQLPEEITHDR
jgi:hypothetical protein